MRLGSICKMRNGGTPSTKNPAFYQGTIPWISTVALGPNYIDGTSAKALISEEAVSNSATKVIPAGSLLVGIRVGVGKSSISTVPLATNQDITSLTEIDEAWNPLFLKFFLDSKSSYFESKKKGATILGITSDDLKSLVVPCVPLTKQESICNEIVSLQDAIQTKKNDLLSLDALIKSRFIEMFGSFDLGRERSEWKRLGELTKIFTGTTPSTSDASNWGGDILWVTPAEMTSDSFYIYDTVRKITEQGRSSKSLDVMPIDTVLLSTRAPIGKVGIVGKPMTCNQGFKNFQCLSDLNPIYLYILLKFNTAYLNSLGAGATFLEISKSKVAEIKIPVPPIADQNAFADFVRLIDKSKFIVQQQIKDLQELLDSKMDEYFGDIEE